jgi:GcrA cell cycle regulator
MRLHTPQGPNGSVQMLWTAEAIDNLKRLAFEGKSASVIAAALGMPSRNAVIGKANRIGIKLNGDGRRSSSGGKPAGAYRSPLAVVPHPRSVSREQNLSALSLEPERKASWAFAKSEVGQMRRVKLEDIRELACRWPLDDPTSRDFAYCGLEPAKGHSYCAGHCRMAYRPPTAAARQRPMERQLSRALGRAW